MLWIAAAVCVAAAALAWCLAPPTTALSPSDERLIEEDAELGPTGLVTLPRP